MICAPARRTQPDYVRRDKDVTPSAVFAIPRCGTTLVNAGANELGVALEGRVA